MEQKFSPNAIRAEAARRGLSYAEIASKSGLGYRAVRDAANGNVDPRVGTLLKIANVIGVPLSSFFVPTPDAIANEQRPA